MWVALRRCRRRVNSRSPTLRALPFLLALAAGFGCASNSHAALPDAVLAHQVLSGFTESFVVRAVVRPAAAPPREEFFTLFRFDGLLWCYSPEIGTGEIGPAPEGAAAPKAALAALQRAFLHLESVVLCPSAQSQPASQNQTDLPNGCVIGCFAQLTRLLVTGDTPDEAGLVLFSYASGEKHRTAAGPELVDHSILVFRLGRRWFCIDPRLEDRPFPLRQVVVGTHLDPTLKILADNPGYPLQRARLLVIAPRTLNEMAARITWNQAAKGPPP